MSIGIRARSERVKVMQIKMNCAMWAPLVTCKCITDLTLSSVTLDTLALKTSLTMPKKSVVMSNDLSSQGIRSPEGQLEDLHPDIIFQQGGTCLHWKLDMQIFFKQIFPGHRVGRSGPIPWLSWLPGFTWFFFWEGYVKDTVFKTKMPAIVELRCQIAKYSTLLLQTC